MKFIHKHTHTHTFIERIARTGIMKLGKTGTFYRNIYRKISRLEVDLDDMKEYYKSAPNAFNMYKILCVKKQLNGLKVKACKPWARKTTPLGVSFKPRT